MSKPMDRDEATRMLADRAARAARNGFVDAATRELAESAKALSAIGYVLRDEPATALSLVTRIASSLAGGAAALLNHENPYGAAALLRQFVEVEYLLWCFADDAGDAAAWLHASPTQLAKRFRPAAMRRRSNGSFRASEYQVHCDQGGHPNPHGARLLLQWEHSAEAIKADLGQHLSRAWELLPQAAEAVESSVAVSERAARVGLVRDEWELKDPWATRAPVPPPE